jgi:DNA-binding transcriptional MerR regulator
MQKIGDVANFLDVSGQTVKNWVSAFPDYFSESAQRNFSKRFTPQDLERLIEIQTLRNQGRQLDEINDLLPSALGTGNGDGSFSSQVDFILKGKGVMTERDAEALMEMLDTTIQAKEEVVEAKDEIIRQHAELMLEKERMHSQAIQDKNKWITELRQRTEQLEEENKQLKERLEKPIWQRR